MAKTAIAEPLNSLERTSLRNAEATIEKGLGTFMDVGTALYDIREGKLYRESHKTFEKYCLKKWGFSRPRAYQLIEAAETTARLSTNCRQIPANEAQSRELSRVPEDQQAAVWEDTLERTGGKPTARDVRETADTDLADNEPYVEPGEPEEEEEAGGPTAEDRMEEAMGIVRKTRGQLTRAMDVLGVLGDTWDPKGPTPTWKQTMQALKKKVG